MVLNYNKKIHKTTLKVKGRPAKSQQRKMAEDRGVPSLLRSGVVGDVVPNAQEDQCTKKLLGLVLSMIQRSATTAGEYAEHAGRKVVMPLDVQMALKYHAMRFFGEESVASLEKSELKEMEDMLEETESEEEDDDDMPALIDDSEEDEEWTRSTCECSVCRDMHAAEDGWEAWNPEDPAEQFLKVSVDKTISQCNN